jgi:hypothetical protein
VWGTLWEAETDSADVPGVSRIANERHSRRRGKHGDSAGWGGKPGVRPCSSIRAFAFLSSLSNSLALGRLGRDPRSGSLRRFASFAAKSSQVLPSDLSTIKSASALPSVHQPIPSRSRVRVDSGAMRTPACPCLAKPGARLYHRIDPFPSRHCQTESPSFEPP